jgi:hypothetical protein
METKTAAASSPSISTQAQRGPFYGTFKELDQASRYCTHCERDLSGHAFRWLELDQRTGAYHDFNDVPPEKSQGWFPFGLTCGQKLVKQEAARRAKATGAQS